MTLVWISDSVQGSFIAGQNLTVNPLILQYLAPQWAKVTLLGTLPEGLSWPGQYDLEYNPNGYISIQGTISPSIIPDTYEFTFRLSDATDGSTLDKTFTMEVLSSPIPTWNVPSNLGRYSEDYSFNLYPLKLSYDAVSGAKVTLLNGNLPPGLNWSVSAGEITISGESNNLTEDLKTDWTFRIKNPNGLVADRTFTLTLTALANIPSWLGQSQFLGYVASGSSAKFAVTATIPGNTPPLYSIVDPIPDGLTINEISGVISYNAPEIEDPEQITAFVVKASTPSADADLEVSIMILSVPHIPMWITPEPGLLKTPQMQYLELPLRAFDSSGREITYAIVDAAEDFPFMIDSQGLLYGPAPKVTNNTKWYVTLSANAGDDSNLLDLVIEVTQVNTLGVLRWRNNFIDYSGILDGVCATYDIGAISTRTRTIFHGITGGQMPPGLVLDKIQGFILGYVDYHTQPKDYWFDITATDGVDSLVRTIHMSVSPRYGYQFMNVSLPLHGDVRQRWIDNNNYVLDDSRMLVNVAIENNQFDFPSLSVIRGLDHTMTDPNNILEQVMPSLQRMDFSIGALNYVATGSGQLFYRGVIDPENGADLTAEHQGPPPTIWPNSLENIRRAFVEACGYANACSGTDTEAFVLIDAEDGSISNIFVTVEGSGYVCSPEIIINGQGTGAVAHAVNKINNARIVDPGNGWVVGEQFYMERGVYTRPARLVASEIGSQGKLTAVQILDGGAYTRLPAGKVVVKNAAGAFTTLAFTSGIDQIVIDNAGTGYYGETTLNFNGNEQLESWQSQWEPVLPMALIETTFANIVVSNSQFSTPSLDGMIWQADQLCMEVQGLYYQGTTSFDNGDTICWDGNTTRFEESLTPLQTIFDENDQTLDLMETTFDVGGPTPRDARDNWGLTLIDEGTTAFEFYQTIFDAATPRRFSSTLVRRYVRLPMPQISGRNVDGTVFPPPN